jgi:predicted ATPase
LGTTLFHTGAIVDARNHLEQAVAVNQRGQALSSPLVTVVDSQLSGLAYLAQALWILGYPEQALQRSDQANKLAQELNNPQNLLYASYYTARLHLHRREAMAADKHAQNCMRLATEHKFPFRLGMATIIHGAALVMQGKGAQGIEQIRQGFSAWQATGGELARPWYLYLLAEAEGQVGRVDEALHNLAKAQVVVGQYGQYFLKAALLRLQGDLLLKQSAAEPARAATCYQQAVIVARSQQAKSLELRAAMSLGRLWYRQGNKAEARKQLTLAYNWFNEGFDTADLKDAKALLHDLV